MKKEPKLLFSMTYRRQWKSVDHNWAETSLELATSTKVALYQLSYSRIGFLWAAGLRQRLAKTAFLLRAEES